MLNNDITGIIAGIQTDNEILQGWYAALTSITKHFVVWNPSKKPVYDFIYEAKPQLIIGDEEDFERYSDIIPAIKDRKLETILILVNTAEESIAANLAKYYVNLKGDTNNDLYKSDLLYISNNQLTPKQEITLQQICTWAFHENINFKIVGQNRHNVYNYLGGISLDEENKFLSNTKIYLDLDNTMVLNCPYNNTFCLVNPPTVSHNDPELPPPQHVSLDNIKHFLDNEKHRKSYIKKYKRFIKNNNMTYFHQVAKKLEEYKIEASKITAFIDNKI